MIKDFGLVKLDEDKTLSASISFPDNGGSGSGSSKNNDSGNNSSGNSSSGSGSSSNSNSGGGSSGSGGSGSGGEAKVSGAKAKELPRTGGDTLPALGLIAALLVGGGLLARRATR